MKFKIGQKVRFIPIIEENRNVGTYETDWFVYPIPDEYITHGNTCIGNEYYKGKYAIIENIYENFYLVKNVSRNIGNLRVGFLEHFNDVSWVKEFKPKDYSKELKRAKKESDKAKKVLRNFKNIDVLVCHAPPYGILDEVSGKFGAPKHWWGKHAGSKVILDYVKKYQPKYVFCGHIHEGKGMKKIGKSIVYNVGFNGDYVLLDI